MMIDSDGGNLTRLPALQGKKKKRLLMLYSGYPKKWIIDSEVEI